MRSILRNICRKRIAVNRYPLTAKERYPFAVHCRKRKTEIGERTTDNRERIANIMIYFSVFHYGLSRYPMRGLIEQ